MRQKIALTLFLLLCVLLSGNNLNANNKVKYKKYKKDKVLKAIANKRNDIKKEKKKITEEIIKKNSALKKADRENRKIISTDMNGVFPPKSVSAFKKLFHFPPVAQYYTSTCWSFSTTSYFESEIYRLTGKKIKLSEMWTVYYELLEKSARYLKERGYSLVAGGGESNGLIRIWKKYGIVPAEIYNGFVVKNKKYDHIPLMRELRSYLDYVKKNNLWDIGNNLSHIRIILDKYMGKPPVEFSFQGKKYTPLSFLNNYTGLRMGDYYSIMSTKYYPFYTRQEFKVPDNWWHNKEYINLPLYKWYGIIKNSIKQGYTICIGGDVSEPGKLGEKDIAFIPDFDIPEKYINQDSREYRIYNKTTDDDHGIHLVGYKRYKGKDWFLIKDSGRSGRYGKFEGYYFFREDFVKLKMLTYTIHKDMLKGVLKRLK